MKAKEKSRLICNCCGKNVLTKENDYLLIRKEWGYFSNKDGEIHSLTICEKCYDEIISKFKNPISIEEQNELI